LNCAQSSSISIPAVRRLQASFERHKARLARDLRSWNDFLILVSPDSRAMRHSRKREATLQVYVKAAYEFYNVIEIALRYWNRFLQGARTAPYRELCTNATCGHLIPRLRQATRSDAIAASDCAFELFAVNSACFRNPTSHPGKNVAQLAFGYSGLLDLKPDRGALKEADNEIRHFLARASGSIRKRL
jgi:hypothetical protein